MQLYFFIHSVCYADICHFRHWHYMLGPYFHSIFHSFFTKLSLQHLGIKEKHKYFLQQVKQNYT